MGLERFSLEGKTAIVTGGSRGIGRAIALGFAEAGADVAVAARTEEDCRQVAKEIEGLGRKAHVAVTDVRYREQIESMVSSTIESLGKLDILVNNAGGSNFMAPVASLRPEGWDKIRTLNLDSVFHATQLAVQVMIDSGGGSIIQIASVAGIQGAQGLSMYSAAKGGVRLFTQAIAKELATSGVRVNTIAPGWIDTDLNQWAHRDKSTEEFLVGTIPMGRMGVAEEVVGAAIYLASDAASFVTGSTLVVDGGQTA